MKTMMKIFLALGFPFWAMAQVPQVMWDKTIGGSQDDQLSSITICQDRGYLLVGHSSSSTSGDRTQNTFGLLDLWIVKLDSIGKIIWNKVYGGSGVERAESILTTKDNGFIICGASSSGISGNKSSASKGGNDYWIIKIDSIGNLVWDKSFGGSQDEYPSKIIQSNDGGYIIVGASKSSISGDKSQPQKGDNDYWIVKIDSLGNKIWDRTIGGLYTDRCLTILPCTDGGYLLGGESGSTISGDKSQNPKGKEDFWLVKIDSIGNILWDKTIGGSENESLFVILNSHDGGYILGGYSFSNISGDKSQNSNGLNDYWIVKTDSIGNLKWDKTYGGSKSEQLFDMIHSHDGGYILIGNSNSPISVDKTQNSDNIDFWIVNIDKGGSIAWEKTIGGNDDDNPSQITRTIDGGYILGGYSSSNISKDKTENSKGINDYWVVKLGKPKNKITGNVFADLNSNCINNNEPRFKNKLIRNLKENTYSMTNDSIYTHYTFTNDTAILTIANLDSAYQVICDRDTIPIIFNTSSNDTQNVNFPIRPKGNTCFQPKIYSFSHSRLVRCNWSNYILNYQNEGFDTLFNAMIILEIDTSQIDSFKSPYAFTKAGNIITFNLGNFPPVSYRSLTYSVKIKCTALLGSSVCHRAAISPLNDCYSYPGYDSSQIAINHSCTNDTVTVKLENMGFAKDMTKIGTIKAYEDELILRIDSFKLNKNTSVSFKYKMDTNVVLTVVANLNNNHPTNSILIRHDDVCAVKAPILFNNPVLHFSRYDDANEYEEDCDIIRGSYDPNDKKVQPEGLFAQHYTKPNETLKYRINFQNIGTDTAFRVVVIDTLSSFLNLASIEPGAASHPYNMEIAGANVLKFIFDPIKLVDSLTNEPASHGYVNFKIKAKANIPVKAVVNNFADIYFDYNAPVRTNTVFNTMYDTIQIYVPKKDTITKPNSIHSMQTEIHVYPNPSTDKFIIQLHDFRSDLTLEVYDMNGKLVYNVNQIEQDVLEIDVKLFKKGNYILMIKDNGVNILRQKLVVGE